MTKWQSEAEMNADLRRIARETRQLSDELRSYAPGESRLSLSRALHNSPDVIRLISDGLNRATEV